LRRTLTERGFSVMVHDYNHDGKLFLDRKIFDQRRQPINDFLKGWSTRGFASGAALHVLPWITELDIDYDISTYDCDPFEPQSCGLGRIFPFWVQSPTTGRGFVELPYTLAQDFTLFILMQEQSNAIWRQKLDWIAGNGGMALIKTHPDYMFFRDQDKQADRYPTQFYTDFLDYVRSRYGNDVWVTTPAEVASYWSGLRMAKSDSSGLIMSQETFCPACHRAHADGWLQQYRPAQTAQLMAQELKLVE
jgi:hypothetical protein